MTRMGNVLRLAAPAALALLIGAPAALAINEESAGECDLPSDAAEDIGGPDFFGDEKICKKVCNELESLCEDVAKNRERCIKDIDKGIFSLGQLECDTIEDPDERKACSDFVKDDQKECKDELKADSKAAKDNCKELYGKDSGCETACAVGEG